MPLRGATFVDLYHGAHSGSAMSSKQQTTIPMPGYPARRHRLTARHRTFSVRPVMEAVGWIVAGEGFGSLAVVAGAWALMRLTSIDDSSSTSSVMLGEGGGLVLAVPPRDANAPSFGM